MQEDTAEKLDELLIPIEVTDKINVIKEQVTIFHH